MISLSIMMVETLTIVSLLVYDVRTLKNHRGPRFALRVLSLSGGLSLLFLDYLVFHDVWFSHDIVDLAVINSSLLVYPTSRERTRLSFRFSLGGLAANLAIRLCFLFVAIRNALDWFTVVTLSNVVLFGSYFSIVISGKLKSFKNLLRVNSVLSAIEEYSRLFYLSCFFCLSLSCYCVSRMEGAVKVAMSLIVILALLILYVVLYLRAATGNSFLMERSSEEKLREAVKGCLVEGDVARVAGDPKMESLYERIMTYMMTDKPFLDSDFDMESLSAAMFSNKQYLSRTINTMSGKNFRQFLNYHRIKYALGLMKDNPKLRVGEVSAQSGFHTVVSFNMAFKVNMGTTPSAWLEEYRFGR